MVREPAMWMSSQQPANAPSSPMTFSRYPPKRDCLLCVARHTAVALTWHAPLSKAQGPGFSVSGTEPTGVFLSRFWHSSCRSLWRYLFLRLRTRPNFFFYLLGHSVHQE